MCEYRGKLVAWLDRELPAAEAAEVQLHFRGCVECRERLAKYQQVSKTLDEYCIAVATTDAQPSRRRLVPLFAGVAAAVFVAALGISLWRTHQQAIPATPVMALGPVLPPRVTTPPAPEMVVGANKPVHRRHVVRPVLRETQNWMPRAPAIRVAIPADAVFPPGAVPEGMIFTADVSIGPDGSAQQIRFRPLWTGLERRPTQP
jgi:hypothetical protein